MALAVDDEPPQAQQLLELRVDVVVVPQKVVAVRLNPVVELLLRFSVQEVVEEDSAFMDDVALECPDGRAL